MIKDNYFASAVEFADHPMRNGQRSVFGDNRIFLETD